MQIQLMVGPMLFYLSNNGVTSEDIIGTNNLVLAFRNRNFLFDTSNHNNQQDNKPSKNYNNIQYWSLFIENLKSLENINLEIEKRLSNLDKLKSQITIMNNKNQEVEKRYLEAVSNFNLISSMTSFLIETSRQINESINKKMVMTPRFSPIFVNLVYNGNNKDGDDNSDNKINKKKLS